MTTPSKAEKEKKPLYKRVIDVFLTVVIVILAVVIALSLYAKKTGRQIFSYTVLWVLSESMEPTIPVNSYILVKSIDAKDVKEDDVITFISRDPAIYGSYNTHRVKKIIGDNEEFETKGDNNVVKDELPVKAEDVTAIYVKNLPLLTFFGRLYATPIGLILTLGCVMATLMIWISNSFKRELKAEKEDEINKLVEEEVKRLQQAAMNKNAEFSGGSVTADNPETDTNDQNP